eukprot:2880069-Rhodomonas_salina.2
MLVVVPEPDPAGPALGRPPALSELRHLRRRHPDEILAVGPQRVHKAPEQILQLQALACAEHPSRPATQAVLRMPLHCRHPLRAQPRSHSRQRRFQHSLPSILCLERRIEHHAAHPTHVRQQPPPSLLPFHHLDSERFENAADKVVAIVAWQRGDGGIVAPERFERPQPALYPAFHFLWPASQVKSVNRTRSSS